MNAPTAIRVLLVDDHRLIRESYRAILSLEPDIKVAGEAADGLQAVQAANELQPDVVIMDVTMPAMGGIEATRLIKESLRHTRVLCMSMHTNPRLVSSMINAGASGYVVKTCKSSELVNAIRTVANGGTYIAKEVSSIIAARENTNANPDHHLFEQLSRRQKDVLRLIADGHETKAIAKELAVSEKTVFVHREKLMQKLGIESVAGLTKYAIREGISII